MRAFNQKKVLLVLILFSFFLLMFNESIWVTEAAASPAVVELYYDDGTAEWEYSWPGAGGMFAVRFTPPASGQLIECGFYITKDPDTFKVHVLDTDKSDVITPFPETPPSTGWFYVDLSTYGITVSADVDFYVAMESTAVSAPWLGADTSDPDGRSWDYDGVSWSQWSVDDYMIRAVIGAGPDLKVTGVRWEPSEIYPDENVTFFADVENLGGEDATDFVAELYLDGGFLASGTFSLAAGANDTYIYEWWTATPGNHTVRWVIDATDVVVETDETNNEMSDWFVVEYGYLFDARIENLVDDDVDGYYEQIDLCWDADTDLAELTVYVRIYGRYEDGESQFIDQDDPYTIYNYDVDWRYFTLLDGATGYWDFRLELYDYATDTLLDILDYEEDPDISNVPMDEVVEYVLTVQTPYGDVTVNVDGEAYTTDAYGKVQVVVSPGNYNVEVPTNIPTGPGSREAFTQWSDGDPSNPRTVSVNSNLILTAEYTTQFRLTVDTDPPGVGGTTGEGWYGSGSVAIANCTTIVSVGVGERYAFTNWMGDVSGTSQDVLITMDGPKTVTANYKIQYHVNIKQTGCETTVTATIDGESHNLPTGFWFDEGSEHSVSVPSEVTHNSDTRYVFTQWHDAETSSSRIIVVTSPAEHTAYYKTQYHLTVGVDPEGIATVGGEGWYDAKTVATTGTAQSVISGVDVQYDFRTWRVDGEDVTGNPMSITMDSSHTAIATYRKKTITTIQPPSLSKPTIKKGKTITVSGSIVPAQEGAIVTLTYRRPDGSTMTRTVTSFPDGTFSDTCTPDASGTWSVTASWLGDADNLGATSQPSTFKIESISIIDILGRPEIIGLLIGLFSVTATVTAFVARRRKRSRVRGLLNEIDDAYFRYKKNTRRCEAELFRFKDVVLEEYKSGDIPEESYKILNERIDNYIEEIREQNE